MSSNHETVAAIINPEIPETADEKLALYKQCMAVLAMGGRVEGVLPLHVTQDCAVMLGRTIRAGETPQSAY